MTLKTLTLDQLRQERADVENLLTKAEYDRYQDRYTHDGPSFSAEWAVRRLRIELDNIEQEMETRV